MPDSQTGSVLKLTFTLWWIPQSSVSSPRLLCYVTRGARNQEIPWKHYYRLKEWSPGLLYVVRGCTIITRKAERKSEFSSIKLYVVIYFPSFVSLKTYKKKSGSQRKHPQNSSLLSTNGHANGTPSTDFTAPKKLRVDWHLRNLFLNVAC